MYIDPPKSNFEPAPPGTHVAILVKLIDLGWQDNEFKGEKKVQHQAMLTWELPGKMMTDGRPFLISKTSNLSMHEKATFRAWAESMVGRKFNKSDMAGPTRFDAKSLLGKSCLLQVEQVEREGKTYAKITNLMQLPEGLPVPERLNEFVYLSLEKDEFDKEIFDGLSQWTREKIEGSTSYRKLRDRPATPIELKTAAEWVEDDIPF